MKAKSKPRRLLIVYAELCKTVRMKMSENTRKYNTDLINSITANKSNTNIEH